MTRVGKRTILKKSYGLLGRVTYSAWYGLGQFKSLKEVRKAYRLALRMGWSESNLQMVRDLSVRELVLP